MKVLRYLHNLLLSSLTLGQEHEPKQPLCESLRLPSSSLGSSSLVRITHARKWPKGLYEIHGSFYTVVCCTENLQGKAMGLLCPYLLLAPCGVIPGQSLGKRLWFTETHIWLLQFFSTLLPGLSCETALISQQVQIQTLPVKYKLYSKEVYFWRSCHIYWVIPCATE